MILPRRQFCQGLGLMAALAMLPGPLKAKPLAGDGFWVPDEAEPHRRTFMQWPAEKRIYPDTQELHVLQQTVADIANTIAEFEPVVMLMGRKNALKARLRLSRAVEIWDISTDDLWCRDSGPLFVRNDAGQLAIRSLNFNAWGGKQEHRDDARVAERVAQRLGLPVLNNGLVGEPGGVETDGQGTLIAHESSWINPNRNDRSKADITARLLEAYGGDKVIWAPGVIDADITDYHIDSLARFIGPGRVLIQLPEQPDQQDPWSVAAFQTFKVLQSAQDAMGRPLDIQVIPEPRDIRATARGFVASYANYYVCNGAVIMPEFGDRHADGYAADILAKAYPDREIVHLNVDPLGYVGGGIHCATQQQPAV